MTPQQEWIMYLYMIQKQNTVMIVSGHTVLYILLLIVTFSSIEPQKHCYIYKNGSSQEATDNHFHILVNFSSLSFHFMLLFNFFHIRCCMLSVLFSYLFPVVIHWQSRCLTIFLAHLVRLRQLCLIFIYSW